jgi:NADPH-dependent glutamate synthase beta subunit-like oxidoreductase/NAD(P)H-flavin reductase
MTPTLNLTRYTFDELRHAGGLSRLDADFLAALEAEHPAHACELLAYRAGKTTLKKEEISELLIHCAIFLEQFVASLFDIEESVALIRAKTTALTPLSLFKKYYILRRAKKELSRDTSLPPFSELEHWLEEALKQAPLQAPDRELSIALLGTHYLEHPEQHEQEIERLVQWCVQAYRDPEGQALTRDWSSFRIPARTDYEQLIPTIQVDHCTRSLPEEAFRLRDGFQLTDPRMDARAVQDEAHYCIYCHDHEGDFCSKGFPVKKGEPALGFKKNPLDITLTGCPLEEKISEMQFLKKEGYAIAPLAMIMVDNPLCPATGHRICNDCMKACIYQKQDPVNIPQIETRVLVDVLHLPWGVEIYDLLTRWNPLRKTQWAMKPYNGLKVLIAGMGPAGFTLAHHLLLEGFAVVGVDGLKIEPLPRKWIDSPIYRYADLEERLDERLMAGFGGVAEYGITVRWDKNFLKLIYLSLMRRPYFQVFGQVRFGGTLTTEDPWEMGFDHFTVAVGAGLPEALAIPNSLAPGMRQANDFLMALQLGNAAKPSSLTNLQVRLPALVIGSGLTAVDTATEMQAYYISQVEKISERYHTLVSLYGQPVINGLLDPASHTILEEYLTHADAIKAERERARLHHEAPNFIKLIRAWGGVSIVYRRTMKASKAYLLNHEELKKALEEGIYYLENLSPEAVELDEEGHVKALQVKNQEGEVITLPARSILVATGTRPNTAYEFEHRGTFERKNKQYLRYEDHAGELKAVEMLSHCKEETFGPFTSYQKEGHRISLVGDTHPAFHGSVVKAIASGMRTYPHIVALFQDRLDKQGDEKEYQQFAQRMIDHFQAEVLEISRKTESIVELRIRAPAAAKHYLPGQFYRLQYFETVAPVVEGKTLAMEPLALPVAEHDPSNHTLTFIVQEKNVAAKLCATIKPGEPVALMGPTGVRTRLPDIPETILIVGDVSSFAFVRSVGRAFKQTGSRVIYLCQYHHEKELYCRAALEEAVNECYMHPQDESGIDNLLHTYLDAKTLANINRFFVIGDAALLRDFQRKQEALFKHTLIQQPAVYGAVYGNMQCMLKGVCAQCLQWQIDPKTGKRTKAVFACSWQNQPIELIDTTHLEARSAQNQLLEIINQRWLDHLFAVHSIERV